MVRLPGLSPFWTCALCFATGSLVTLIGKDIMNGTDIQIILAWLLPPALLAGLVGFIAARAPAVWGKQAKEPDALQRRSWQAT